MFIKKSLMAFT